MANIQKRRADRDDDADVDAESLCRICRAKLDRRISIGIDHITTFPFEENTLTVVTAAATTCKTTFTQKLCELAQIKYPNGHILLMSDDDEGEQTKTKSPFAPSRAAIINGLLYYHDVTEGSDLGKDMAFIIFDYLTITPDEISYIRSRADRQHCRVTAVVITPDAQPFQTALEVDNIGTLSDSSVFTYSKA